MFKLNNYSIAGTYIRNPVENDWHVVTITPQKGGFLWSNSAGHSWSLSDSTFSTDKMLRSEGCCPYPGQDVTVVLGQANQVIALSFQGEMYLTEEIANAENQAKPVLAKKKVIKVTYKGDMKRMKATSDFAALVAQTHKAFGQNTIPQGFKFFYLDEDSEMASISSQYDLDQANDIEDLTVLKLTASTSAKEARAQLCQDISEVMSMTDNLNQSGFFTAPSTDNNSLRGAFDSFRLNAMEAKKIAEPVQEAKPQSEIEKPLSDTELVKLFGQELPKCARATCNFQRKSLKDGFCCGVCRKNGRKGRHGNGCHKIEFEAPAAKAEAEAKAPVEEEQVVNNIVDIVSEVSKFAIGAFEKLLSNCNVDKRTKQAEVEHKDHICDGCEAETIKGIRYQCSVCPDYDLCATCEGKGVHAEHPMLKIRNPSQAPHQLICEYAHIETSKENKEIIKKLREQAGQPEEKPEVVQKPRTYAEVVKGVKAPEVKTTTLGYPTFSEDSKSEKPEASIPIVCTLSEEFLKTLKVENEDPRTVYNNKTVQVESSATREHLYDLFELGQTNFEVNLAMLNKYNFDLPKTASHLCAGDLSESVIAKAFK